MMYLEHFGFNEAPFRITPHTEFFFAGANRGATLDALIYAITSGEGLVKVTGEVGAGKTMLCRVLMERLPKSVETIYLAVPSLSRDEILIAIASDLGLETDGRKTHKLIRALQERLIEIHSEGRQVVALIDEAHAMPLDSLEEIRLLSNLETAQCKLMQMVLFGQPELDEHLALPNMRQLRERITHSFRLLPLPANDIRDYVNFRIRMAGYKGPDLFSEEALKLIADASEGLTRRINIYADKTLLAAYAGGTHTVTLEHVRAAIKDTLLERRQKTRSPRFWGAVVAAGLAAGVALGFGVARLTGGDQSPPSPSPPTNVSSGAPANPTPAAATPDVKVETAPEQVKTPASTDTAPRVSNAPPSPPAPAKVVVASGDPAKAVPADTPAIKVSDKEPSKSVEAATRNATAAAASRALEQRISADQHAFLGLADTHYSIQLMTADAREAPATAIFLRQAARELDASQLLVYAVGSAENPRVRVIFGSFPSYAAAQAAVAAMPERMQRFKPYARNIAALRAEARQPS